MRADGRRDGAGEAVFDSGARDPTATARREDRCVRVCLRLAEPRQEDSTGAWPKGNDSLLAPFAVNAETAAAIDGEVGNARVGDLRDARARIVERREHRVVAAPSPCRAVGRGDDRRDLVAREEAKHSAVEPLHGDGEYTLNGREGSRALERGEL